jgi:membrane protein
MAMAIKRRFSDDHVALTAAGVAFYGFVAVVPLIVAAVSVYGLLADPSDIATMVNELRSAAPEEVVQLVEQQLEAVASAPASTLGLATALSIAVALWSASSGFGHLIEAVNIAYDEHGDGRPFWKRRLVSLAFTIGFLAYAVTAVVVLQSLPGFSSVLGWMAVGVSGLLGLSVLYRFGPDRDDPQWQWLSLGSVFSMVAWLVVSLGFRFYVTYFGSYNETYGALGSIVVVLTWLYLSAVVVIVGAQINSTVLRQASTELS